jgi:hypothetical protein
MTITPNTDTYGTVAEADAYFLAGYGYTKWDGLDEPTKEQLLRSAVQHEDLLCDWYGNKSDSDQLLEFPRNYVTNEVDADPTPQAIKNAQFEIAYAIIDTGSTTTDGGDPLTELKAGSVTMKFNATSTSNPIVNSLTLQLLEPYGACSGTGNITLIRN